MPLNFVCRYTFCTTTRWFTMAGILKLVFLSVQDWTINLFASDLTEEIDGKI